MIPIPVLLFALQEAIKLEPQIADGIRQLLTKGEPSDADWEALHAKYAAKSYWDYVPGSALPRPATPAPELPAAPVQVRVLPTPIPPQVDPLASFNLRLPATPATPSAELPSGSAASQPVVTLEKDNGADHRTISLAPIDDASEHRTQSLVMAPAPVTPGPVTPAATPGQASGAPDGAKVLAQIADTLKLLVAALPKA